MREHLVICLQVSDMGRAATHSLSAYSRMCTTGDPPLDTGGAPIGKYFVNGFIRFLNISETQCDSTGPTSCRMPNVVRYVTECQCSGLKALSHQYILLLADFGHISTLLHDRQTTRCTTSWYLVRVACPT